MGPAGKYAPGKWLAGAAVVSALAVALAVGSANARIIEWASTEQFFTPSVAEKYSSDCLIPGGQRVHLKDWNLGELQRDVLIGISRPAPTQAPTEAPTEAPTDAPTEEATQAPTQEATQTPTQEATQPATEAPSDAPTEAPTDAPTEAPTDAPTDTPTEAATEAATEAPTNTATEAPSDPVAVMSLDATEENSQTEATDPTTAPQTEATEAATDAPTDPTQAPTTETEASQPSDSQTTEPSDAETTEPETTEPETTEPETTDPETTEPDTTEPDTTEPEASEPEAIEPEASEPTRTWTDGEVEIALDDNAAAHLSVSAEVSDSQITVHLTLRSDAPGLAQSQLLTFHVQWQDLEATFEFTMQPYGDITTQDLPAEETQARQIVTGLQLSNACDVVDTEDPIAVLRLNLETCEDFTIRIRFDENPIQKMRWSTDGGKTYSMLYESHEIRICWPYPEGWDGTVLLKFPEPLSPEKRPTISVSGSVYSTKEHNLMVKAVPQAGSFLLKIHQLPYKIKLDSTVWGSTVLVPQNVQRLSYDENGLPVYTDDLTLTASADKESLRLQTTQQGVAPKSGSYRLTLLWTWEGVTLEERTIYFYVNTH